MAETSNTSRAFIIGDLDKGLTIVVTDPVMVAHYTIDELMKGKKNLLKTKDTTNLMAALVRELIPIFRGVELDELERAAAKIANGKSTLDQAQQRAVFTELDFAATIARVIKAQGTVSTVDFCIGLDIDPNDISARVRSVSPSRDIIGYLKTNRIPSTASISNRPQVFPIEGVNVRNLGTPKAWKNPLRSTTAQAKALPKKRSTSASSKVTKPKPPR